MTDRQHGSGSMVRARWSFLWALVASAAPAPAQTLSFEEPIRVDPRFGGEATVELSTPEEVLGWSFGIRHDAALLVPVDATMAGLEGGEVNDGAGPDFARFDLDPPGGPGLTAEVVVSFSDGDVVPPGAGIGLARVRYAAGPQARAGATGTLRFADDLGDPPMPVVVVVPDVAAIPTTRDGRVLFQERPVSFIRGDATGEGLVDISDPITVLNHLFGRRPVDCEDAVDTNDDGRLDIADAIYLLSYMFMRGPVPPAPFPSRGGDPTADLLGCMRWA